MKAKIILFLALTFTGLNVKAQTQNHKKRTVNDYTAYRKYVNKKYGFAFQYPNTWAESGQAAEVVNLNNITTNLTVSFTDSKTNSMFTLDYYLPPMGKKLYEDAVTQYNSSQGWYAKDSRKMVVAGNNAFVANMETTVDGKGHQLSNPVKIIIVTFLDKQQTGEMKLQLSVQADQPNEVKNFNKVLSSFEFIHAN